MKRTTLTITILLMITLLLTSCGSKTIKIERFDGKTIEISKDGLSDEQIEVLEEVANGSEMSTLIQSDLFTKDELTEMNILNNFEEKNPFDKMKIVPETDFSEIDINDLDLENLSDVQIETVKKLIAGEITLQEITSKGLILRTDLINIGLIQAGPSGGRGKGNN